VGLDVSFNQLVLLDEVLDGRQVLARVLGGEKRLHFAQPEVEVLDSGDVSALLVRFLQLKRLLGGLLGEELPLLGDGSQTTLQTSQYIFHATASLHHDEHLKALFSLLPLIYELRQKNDISSFT